MVRNYSTLSKDRWIPAKVVKQTGPVSYKCELPGSHIVRRQQDQILTRSPKLNLSTPKKSNVPNDESLSTHLPTETEISDGVQMEHIPETPVKQAAPVRHSTRVVKPPNRLDL